MEIATAAPVTTRYFVFSIFNNLERAFYTAPFNIQALLLLILFPGLNPLSCLVSALSRPVSRP
jgi:hypothetical protein